MARIDLAAAGGRNTLAFLDMLAAAEIGPAMLGDRATDDGYRVLVGSRANRLILFCDYADHPIADDADAIEYAPGRFSTAAGRYQILNTYWPHYRRALGLADFGPASQDHYALKQIEEQGAAADVRAGRIAAAIAKCANIWASLPGADYGQATRGVAWLTAAFCHAGGVPASD